MRFFRRKPFVIDSAVPTLNLIHMNRAKKAKRFNTFLTIGFLFFLYGGIALVNSIAVRMKVLSVEDATVWEMVYIVSSAVYVVWRER